MFKLLVLFNLIVSRRPTVSSLIGERCQNESSKTSLKSLIRRINLKRSFSHVTNLEKRRLKNDVSNDVGLRIMIGFIMMRTMIEHFVTCVSKRIKRDAYQAKIWNHVSHERETLTGRTPWQRKMVFSHTKIRVVTKKPLNVSLTFRNVPRA